MIFETHPLSPHIDQHIESVFYFKHFMPDHSKERVVPTGHIFLIFELDDKPRNTFDNQTLEPNQVYTKVWLSGMHRNYITISAHEDSEMLVVQFKPFGGHPFLHKPCAQFSEQVLAGETVFGDEILTLREQLYHQSTFQEKFNIIEQWLNQRFNPDLTAPQELLTLVTRLQAEPVIQYQQIIDSYPHTHKTLIDQFKKYIGLTPKHYQRIVRFNDILQHIQQQQNIAWSDVANQCGFSDQSHFIKEFKHFSGFNPKDFIDEQLNMDEPNFFPLDREG